MENRTIRTDDVRRSLRALLSQIEHDGTHVTITRYDIPSAVIVPVEWYEQARQALANKEEKP